MKTKTKQHALTLMRKRFFTQLTRIKLVQRAMRLAIRIVVPTRRVAAAIVLFNNRGELLLLHHVFHGNSPWGLPGGWVNRRELPDQAAARELLEETGLTAQIGKAILFTSAPPGHSVDVYFYASNPRGELALSGEINSAAWVSPDSLPAMMLPRNRQAIKLAQAHHSELQARQPAATAQLANSV